MALIPSIIDLKNSVVNTTQECYRNFAALDRNAKMEVVVKTCAIAALAGITVYYVSTPIIVAVCVAKITLYLATRTQRGGDNNMFEAFVRGVNRQERMERVAAHMMGRQPDELRPAPVNEQEAPVAPAMQNDQDAEQVDEEERVYVPIPDKIIPHVEEIFEEAAVPEAKAPAAAPVDALD